LFAKRIREIRDRFFDGNNVRFAETIGAKEASVRSWITGRSVPGGLYLAQICVILNVSPAWLLTGRGQVVADPLPIPDLKIVARASSALKQTQRLLRAVPILSDPAAAGDPRNINDNDIEDFAVIYDHWHGREQRALRIKGESMSPLLHDGDIVGIDISLSNDPRELNGRIVSARCADGVVIKRLTLSGSHVVLLSENPDFPPLVFDVQHDAIIGPVIWAWHKF